MVRQAQFFGAKSRFLATRGRNWQSHAVTPAQCREARRLLGWNAMKLAQTAEVAKNTVLRFERGEEIRKHNVTPIRAALERNGIEFMAAKAVILADGTRVAVEGHATLLPDGSMIRLKSSAS